jgi:rhodanese-related sulfurtransferase
VAKFEQGGVASPAEAAALLTAGGWTPLDVRTADEVAATRALPRAHAATLIARDAASGAQAPNAAFLAHVAARFPDKGTKLLVLCSDGRSRSPGALRALEASGYSRLAGLRGGFNAFAREFLGADAHAAHDDVAWIEWAPAAAAMSHDDHAPSAVVPSSVDHAAAAADASRGAARAAWAGAWAGAAWAGAAAAAEASAHAAAHEAAAAHWRASRHTAATLAWAAAGWSGAAGAAHAAAHAAARAAAQEQWRAARHSGATFAWSDAAWTGAAALAAAAAAAQRAPPRAAASSPEEGERTGDYVIYRF